jgi:ribosomal protein S14
MLAKKMKDLRFRKLFSKFENLKKINKFIFINLLSKKPLKTLTSSCYLNILKLQQKTSRISKVRLKNRCILTNKNTGLNRDYSLSRIKMRELMQFGIIPGSKKAVW